MSNASIQRVPSGAWDGVEDLDRTHGTRRADVEATDVFRGNLTYRLDCHDPGVQVWYPPSSREPGTQAGYPLRWSAGGHGWFGKTDEGIVLFVPEAVYEERLRSYLARRGMELLAWTQVMCPAEAAWRQQCEVLWACWADLDFWQNCYDPDVLVTKSEL